MTEEVKEKETEVKTEEASVNFQDMMVWTDEQCADFDQKQYIKSRDIRDLIIRSVNAMDALRQIEQELNIFKGILGNGEVLGYVIKCPKCGVEYRVTPQDLHFEEEITCQDCSEKYIQNKNIIGVFLREQQKNDKEV